MFLGGFRFKPFAVPKEVTARLAQIEAGKKRILCAPGVYERVRDAVYGAGDDADFAVLENRWLKDGQVIVMQSEVEIEADMQAAGLRMMNEAIERLEQERRAADELRRTQALFDTTVYRSGPRSWIAPGF